jgi:hypothetical protein
VVDVLGMQNETFNLYTVTYEFIGSDIYRRGHYHFRDSADGISDLGEYISSEAARFFKLVEFK